MTIVYIEPRPKGRPEGAPIEDYAVETKSNEVLRIFKTQNEAITWAQSLGQIVHVARVRHTNKGNPDHWRRV
jgi:hypothetical protein